MLLKRLAVYKRMHYGIETSDVIMSDPGASHSDTKDENMKSPQITANWEVNERIQINY